MWYKAQYYMMPRHLENQEGWKWPNYCCLSHSDPGKATCSQTILLLTGTGHSSCLSLRSRFQLPASPWNYSNKPIPSSCGNQRVPHPLDTTKPAPRPLLFTLFPRRGSRCSWLAHVFSSPALGVHVAIKLPSISSIQCPVSCIWPSP